MYHVVNCVGMTAPPCAFDAFGGVFIYPSLTLRFARVMTLGCLP